MSFRFFLFFTPLFFVLACTDSKVDQSKAVEGLDKDSITLETEKEEVIIPPIINPIDYDTSEWTELTRLDETIELDLRYATTQNFVNEQLYQCGRCFLRPEPAAAVKVANDKLKSLGYRLKMFDCFRPLPVQQKLWDKFQNASYVTPPTRGSMHNRGLAVDLTIIDSLGEELDMGTAFDFFGKEAHHTYTGHSETVNKNRILLKETMESSGFKGIRTEWWHYSFTGTNYPLSDMFWECEGF